MKKLLPSIIVAAFTLPLVSCTPAPVHVHDISVVKVTPKKKISKPRKVYVKPKDSAESFRAISH